MVKIYKLLLLVLISGTVLGQSKAEQKLLDRIKKQQDVISQLQFNRYHLILDTLTMDTSFKRTKEGTISKNGFGTSILSEVYYQVVAPGQIYYRPLEIEFFPSGFPKKENVLSYKQGEKYYKREVTYYENGQIKSYKTWGSINGGRLKKTGVWVEYDWLGKVKKKKDYTPFKPKSQQ